MARGNSSAQDQGFGPKSPDPFPSLRVGSGDETRALLVLGSDAIMACCVKVCVCLVQGGEISAKRVWRFDGNEIDSYCVDRVGA